MGCACVISTTAKRTDYWGKDNGTARCNKRCNFANPPNIFDAVFITEPEICIQPKTQIVTIEHNGKVSLVKNSSSHRVCKS
jgi:hypothetical protein